MEILFGQNNFPFPYLTTKVKHFLNETRVLYTILLVTFKYLYMYKSRFFIHNWKDGKYLNSTRKNSLYFINLKVLFFQDTFVFIYEMWQLKLDFYVFFIFFYLTQTLEQNYLYWSIFVYNNLKLLNFSGWNVIRNFFG